MRLEAAEGNFRTVREVLKGMVDSDRVPHAMMFHEDDGGGGMELCLSFLEYLMGGSPKVPRMIHPDVHFIYPVNSGSLVSSSSNITSETYIKEFRALVLGNPYFTERDLCNALGIEGKTAIIAVAQAHLILQKLSFNSLERGYKAVVIYLPEKMNQDAANRLLKCIEEPSEKTQFLMVTHNPDAVLKTISSRCQTIRLEPLAGRTVLDEEELSDRKSVAEYFSLLASRNLFDALACADAFASIKSRERVKGCFCIMEDYLRNVFLYQQGLDDMVRQDDNEARALSRVSRKSFPRLAMEAVNRASMLYDRNVNPRIIFADLTDKLFVKI